MIGTMDLETKTKKSFLTPSFSDATEIQEYINGYSTVVGHNIIGFDVPVMNDLLGITLPNNVVDTLILSRLYNPQIEGGHSLRAWGERLGFRKGDHDDWSTLSDEMIEYCERDLDVTAKLYTELTEKLEEFQGESIELEHEVQRIITEQEKTGWKLDVERAFDIQAKLKQRSMEVRGKFIKGSRLLRSSIRRSLPNITRTEALVWLALSFLGIGILMWLVHLVEFLFPNLI